MKNAFLLTAMTVALFMAGTQQVAAQCSGQIELTATLNAEESGEASAAFNVDLQSIDVDLTWTGSGGHGLRMCWCISRTRYMFGLGRIRCESGWGL